MALAASLLKGNRHEWALLKRHSSEKIFGVQIAGGYGDLLARTVEVIDTELEDVDFIDLNMGCPLDGLTKKRAGSGLLRLSQNVVREVLLPTVYSSGSTPFTCKIRTGFTEAKQTAHSLVARAVRESGVMYCTLHGRSKEGRYTKPANWEYIEKCAQNLHSEIDNDKEKGRYGVEMDIQELQMCGNGDILSWEDWYKGMEIQERVPSYATNMIGRGALIKPWIFKEIAEKKVYDIRSSERFDMLKKFCDYGLEHYGCDEEGVSKTRKFLLEWQSFLCR